MTFLAQEDFGGFYKILFNLELRKRLRGLFLGGGCSIVRWPAYALHRGSVCASDPAARSSNLGSSEKKSDVAEFVDRALLNI